MAGIRLDRRAIPHDASFSTWRGRDGWKHRRLDWPAASARARGRILFLGGRGDFIEKYLEAFSHWHAGGWAVTSLDWRGQGGSGRLAADPNVGHVYDFGTYIDDLSAFWRDWRSGNDDRSVLIAHSMGGHLALRAMAEEAVRPDAAVLIAPMLGLHSPVGRLAGEALARCVARAGMATRPAWKDNVIPGTHVTRQMLLTHDPARYADEQWWHDNVATLKLGPPSWGWLASAFSSTRMLARDRRLSSLDVPILMMVAEQDRLVSTCAALSIAAKLPRIELIRFGPEASHEILREVDAVRDRALAGIDDFLDRMAPAP